MDIHSVFASENSMSSFLMSAKSGDQVNQAFLRIASNLAGALDHLMKHVFLFSQ